MAKKSKAQAKPRTKPVVGTPSLFTAVNKRHYRVLILPRVLRADADNFQYRGQRQDDAHAILKKWMRLEKEGHLAKKETALDADFLHEIFGEALGYQTSTKSPEKYHLQRNFTVPGVGVADGALGEFTPLSHDSPVAVIELKDAGTDLDRDKFNGRTPVQQCWDYLNALPKCPWGIVSNFVSARLYYRDKTPLAYQEFFLKDMDDVDKFRDFYCLFEYSGLLTSPLKQPPRALALLEKSENRQREVSDTLYETYRDNRYRLIEYLHKNRGKTAEQAIAIAQKIIDRIIFIAFCEDRDLLPEKCIALAYNSLPPFSKVTNPRWQNFLGLFSAVDKGHSSILMAENGYNGGLFRHDAEVDDLQLDDSWTNFFNTIGSYDFKDEVNVEVLGHLFEKSISELEQIRKGGLFASNGNGNGDPADKPAMGKSPERKRFGIYYTPPEFTQFIVQNTIGVFLKDQTAALRKKHGLDEKALDADKPAKELAAYWLDVLEGIKQVKICDPACGSGAFLIQAYDLMDDRYLEAIHNLMFHGGPAHESLLDQISDLILANNLYGIDVSPQSVEITQLALWIRSARRGKTLADLSHNILCRNSLVSDPAVAGKLAMTWPQEFPEVFGREGRQGFDCIIGNPPWERMKLQEREHFAFSAPRIANAVSAATRRELIAKLATENPKLHDHYLKALHSADAALAYVRNSKAYPLTGKGDINTYMVFAELARSLVVPHGRVGMLMPSGIATDHTTKEFFAALMQERSLVAFLDFENRQRIFPDVDGRFKFCVLLITGAGIQTSEADFVFFAHEMENLNDPQRHIRLSNADIELLNPNTHTCPIFRSRRDAELTKAIYRRVPVLIDQRRVEGGNPWGIKFLTMFHQTNDAELFHSPEKLTELGFRPDGNRWVREGEAPAAPPSGAKGSSRTARQEPRPPENKQTFLPLYEAKMIQAYDHRAASVKIIDTNWMRQGQTEGTSLVDHQNPEFVVQPRWWVDEKEVARLRKDANDQYFLSYKDVTSATNQRTMIAAMIPRVAVANSAPLIFTGKEIQPRQTCCLLGNLNSLALDFIGRQKVGGLHLNFFIVEQLPIFAPDQYQEPCPWKKRQTLEKWISDRVLKLTCTANDMKPLAEAAGFDPPVHKWKTNERIQLMAELDAAFFHLYGIQRDDVEYILSTFSGMREEVEDVPGLIAPPVTILKTFDELLEASR